MAMSNSSPLTSHVQSAAASTKLAQEVEQGKAGLEQASEVVSGFSTILSLLQQGAEITTNEQNKDVDSNDFISQLQQSLLGQLGLSQSGEGSFEQKVKSLTSDESLEKLQAAFLVSLQQSLFASKNKENSVNPNAQTEAQADTTNNSNAVTAGGFEALGFGANGLDLSDGFDTVNILNHVPVVSEVYKKMSGHDVSAISKLAGGYLYGGPAGLAFSALDLASSSLFDNSISGLLANADYAGILNSITGQEKIENKDNTQQRVSSGEDILIGQQQGTVYWPNRAPSNE